MSNFSINDCNDSGAYQIFRGINKSDKKYDWQKTDDSSIIDLAGEKAKDITNKSALTVALEDFTKTTTGFHSSNCSNIVENDTKPGFLDKVGSFFGQKNDNMFKSEKGQQLIQEKGSVFQNDLFNQDYAKNGGVQYAKEGDDIYESALNFAKADIGAIEKAYQMAKVESNNNKKLEFGEINSYMEYDGNLVDALKEMDLDGDKKKISPEEYASYLVATDGIKKTADGTITGDEAQEIKDFTNADFQKIAQGIYDEHYKK